MLHKKKHITIKQSRSISPTLYATVSPCKVGAIDGRLRNFTQITLHPTSWHVLKPETAKRNDRNKTNKTNETTVTAVMTTTKRLQRSSS